VRKAATLNLDIVLPQQGRNEPCLGPGQLSVVKAPMLGVGTPEIQR